MGSSPIARTGILKGRILDSWLDRAACKEATNKEVEYFFHGNRTQKAMIKQFCNNCPVREECLQDALKEPARIRYGARGGLTESQLQRYDEKQKQQFSQ
jgi:hypothetical protein